MTNAELVKELLKSENSNVSELAKILGQTRQNLSKKLKRDTLTNEEMNSIANHFGLEYRSAFAKPNSVERKDFLDAMTSNFSNIYEVDVETKKLTILRNEGETLFLKNAIDYRLDFDSFISIYIENDVYEEDRQMMREALKFETVIEALRQSSMYKMHYRVFSENRMDHYELKCTPNTKDSSFSKFFLGFSCEEYDYLLMERFSHMSSSSLKRTILIVDNDDESNECIKNILKENYDLIFAKDGEEGYKILSNKLDEIALVVLDLHMPILDSEGFLRRVKGDIVLSNIPIIISVNREEVSKSFKCLELGASDFVTKPYNETILKNRIDNLISLVETKYTLSAVEFDAVTNLYNKESFMHRVDNLVKGDKKRDYDMIIADIDHFSDINRQYGTNKGNEVLIYFSEKFKTIFPKTLYASRLRDDIFIIIIPHAECFDSDHFLKAISNINTKSPVKGLNVKYGIYLEIDKTLSTQIIIDRCQWTLETIYNRYGYNVAFFDDEIIRKRARENYIENQFNESLKKKQFEVRFQPKFFCMDDMLSGAEALVRWNLDGEVISPKEFISICEKNGSISLLDEYVFRSVCEFQKNRFDSDKPLFPISINLSRISIKDENVALRYGEIARSYGIDTKYLPIEITENFAVEKEIMKEVSKAFFKEGFQLHMDDFGSGYSSLSGINTVNFSVIKLDKSLIDFIGTANGESLIKHTVKFIHESNMKVIAEGVETINQLEFLKSIGCDEIQGYYYFPPLKMNEFIDAVDKYLSKRYEKKIDHNFKLLRKKDVMGVLENDIVSEELVSNIVGPVALMDVYDDGRIITRSCNKKLLDVLKTDMSMLTNIEKRNARLFVKESEYDRFNMLFENAKNSPTYGFTDEFRILKPTKEEWWCCISAYYLRKSRNGNLFYCYFHDNKESSAIGNFMNRIPGGYLIYKANESEDIIYSNQYLWKMLGCETENEFMEYTKGSFKGIPCKEDLDRVEESIYYQIDNFDDSLDYVEYRIKRKDGTYLNVLDYGRYVDNTMNEEKFFVFIMDKDFRK